MGKNTEPLPYFKWLWRDWRANRKVQRLDYVARGLYRDLLDEQPDRVIVVGLLQLGRVHAVQRHDAAADHRAHRSK